MTIETKYNVGETVYFQIDDVWCAGEIDGIRTDGEIIVYEIAKIQGDALGFTRKREADISTEKPEGFKKLDEYVALFPEFNEEEKFELLRLVRRLQQQAAKRKPVSPREVTITEDPCFKPGYHV